MAGSKFLKSNYHATEICLGLGPIGFLKQITTLESQREKQMGPVTKAWLYVVQELKLKLPLISNNAGSSP